MKMVWFWAWKMAWWMGFMIHDGMRISKLYYHPPESWHKWILIGGGFKMDSHPPDISAFSSDVILLEQRGNGINPSICQFDSVPWTIGTWIPTQLHPSTHALPCNFFLSFPSLSRHTDNKNSVFHIQRSNPNAYIRSPNRLGFLEYSTLWTVILR